MPFTRKRSARKYSSAKKTRKARTTQRKAALKRKVGLNKVEKKQVKKIISYRKEDRYSPSWYSYDDYAAYLNYLQPARGNPITLPGIMEHTDNAVSMVGFQTGAYLNTVSTQVNTNIGAGAMVALGGFSMRRGDAKTQIDGDYAYLTSSYMTLQINAEVNNNNDGDAQFNAMCSPLEFRVIHVQAKKEQSGVTPSLTTRLFYDLTHDQEGLSMAGSVKEIMHDFPINRDNFEVKSDFKFRLTQPQQPSTLTTVGNDSTLFVNQGMQGQGTPPTYPAVKHLKLWCPKTKKKIRFSTADDGSQNDFEPTNWNFVNYVVILCSRVNAIPGSVSGNLQQTSRCWSVRATGQTKYKDC